MWSLTANHLHSAAGSSRSFTATRKDAGLCCGSRVRSGEVFAYVRLPHNLKDAGSKEVWRKLLNSIDPQGGEILLWFRTEALLELLKEMERDAGDAWSVRKC